MDHRQALDVRVIGEAELRAFELGEAQPGKRVGGLAARYNVEIELRPGLVEVIRPQAFTRALSPESRDVKLLVGHDGGQPLASRRADTLKLKSTPEGLRFAALLPDTQLGHDTWESVRRGDLSGASIGFRIRSEADDVWEKVPAGRRRVLADVDLFEISLTALPVDQHAVVEARSLDVGRRLLDQDRREIGEALARARVRQQLALAWTAHYHAAAIPTYEYGRGFRDRFLEELEREADTTT